MRWFFSRDAQQSSKESFRGALITARLNQDVDDVAVLIHRTPEILLLAVDSNEDFVQVPNIAKPALTPLQFSGIVRTELLAPEPNRLIRDGDSPFGEKILDIAEAQAETMVSPDGVTDDFRRETVTVIRATDRSSSDQSFISSPNLTMPIQGLSKSLESSLLSILRSSATLASVVVSPIRAISSTRVNSDISKDVTSGATTKSAGCTPTEFML